MFVGKTFLPLIFGLAILSTSALPVPSPHSDADIQDAINQLEDLDFGSNFIDTPQKEAEKAEELLEKLNNSNYKRDPQDNFPISFGDVITPSLGGTFNAFVTADKTPTPEDTTGKESTKDNHEHEDFLPAGLSAASLTGDDASGITPLQPEDPVVASELSSLIAAGALPTSI